MDVIIFGIFESVLRIFFFFRCNTSFRFPWLYIELLAAGRSSRKRNARVFGNHGNKISLYDD